MFSGFPQSQFVGGASSPPYTGTNPEQGDNFGAEGGGYQKKNYAKNLMPVDIRTLLQHHDNGEPLIVHGQTAGMVVIVGQLRRIEEGNLSRTYLVEDDTGRIEAIHYIENDEALLGALTQPPQLIPNTFIKIIGSLKVGRGQNMLTVFKVITIRDMDEVVAHKLELTVLPLRQARQQSMAALAAQASFNSLHFLGPGGNSFMSRAGTGNSQFGGPGILKRQVTNQGEMFSHPKVGQGALRQTTMDKGYFNAPRSLQTNAIGQSRNSGGNGFEFAPPVNDEAQKILKAIKYCPQDVGMKIQDLASNFRSYSEPKLRGVLDYLISEGYIYTTVDDSHFKSTDS